MQDAPRPTPPVWTDEIDFDDRGLVPVVAQDAASGEVLMLAWADREALERTRTTGDAHYFSRSRQAIWRKGETSGHVQRVRAMRADCDSDAVLYLVDQTGPACHTGERTCFHRQLLGSAEAGSGAGRVLDRLAAVVARRDEERPEGSYTTYLFEQGIDKVLKKVGEESAEVIIAAKNGSAEELRNETADLLYHLLVLLRAADLPAWEVWRTLEERFGVPGIDTGADP
jgi:phosphoribosyl-AMP cyclohydrolase / phosphoribosyl-ATP pyrophosphohydrolase